MMKLLVIYIDCLDPRLAALFSIPFLLDHPSCDVHTPVPPPYATGPSCATIYTGVAPETHGMTLDGWNYGVKHFTSIRTKTIFDAIGEAGYRQAVLNMPVTWPVREIPHTVLIAGFPSFLDSCCSPESVRRHLPWWYRTDVIPESTVGFEGWDWLDAVLLDYNKAMLYAGWVEQSHAYGPLLRPYGPEVMWVGLQLVDRASHQLRDDMDRLVVAYSAAASIADTLLRAVQPDDFAIMSDHGFGQPWRGMVSHAPFPYAYTSWGAEVRDLTWWAPVISDRLGISTDWIGSYAGWDEDVLTPEESESITNRLCELGYVE